jgi:hypothetical protein
VRGGYLKDAAEVQEALKTALKEVACGGFQKCFKNCTNLL